MAAAPDHSHDPVPPTPEPGIELAPGVRALPGALRLQYSRGSGPGGQNVNKVNTKAELWISVPQLIGLHPGAQDRLRQAAGRRLTLGDEVHLASDAHRTQEANRNEVLDRLREMIVQAQVQPKRRRKTRPSAASNRRRLESKRHRSEIKSKRRDSE